MNFIVLLLVSVVRRLSATYMRIMISATFGALWAVIVVISEGNVRIVFNVCTYTLTAYLMVKLIAVGCDFIENIKSVAVMYAVTFLLSGCMHMLYYYTDAGYRLEKYILRDSALFVLVILSVIIVSVIINELLKIKQYQSVRVKVLIIIAGIKTELAGIVDTGNVLVDPVYNRPVCVVQRNSLPQLEKCGDLNDLKYHIIPFRSIGCENGLLEVIVADEMYISGKNINIKLTDALIGLADMELSSDREFKVLVNNAYR